MVDLDQVLRARYNVVQRERMDFLRRVYGASRRAYQTVSKNVAVAEHFALFENNCRYCGDHFVSFINRALLESGRWSKGNVCKKPECRKRQKDDNLGRLTDVQQAVRDMGLPMWSYAPKKMARDRAKSRWHTVWKAYDVARGRSLKRWQ